MKRLALVTGILLASINLCVANIISINSVNDFTGYVQANKNPIVVEVYSAGCGACKMIAPTVLELAQQYPQVTFIQVEYQNAEALVDYLDVMRFPTFFFYNNSLQTGSLVGANKDKLKKQVELLSALDQ